jgi:competence protein ComFC
MIAPAVCQVCSNLLENSRGNYSHICRKCELLLPAPPAENQAFDRFIQNFDKDSIAITSVYGLFSVHDEKDFLQIIHGLKYFGFTKVGKEFSSTLGKELIKNTDISYSAIVPVPLHPAKKRERGFNQADIIAKTISRELNVPVLNAVKRNKYTQTQTQLSKNERQNNVSDVFELSTNKVNFKLKNYLIVDDVLTTGSTVNACATILLEAGASRIDCACLAIA